MKNYMKCERVRDCVCVVCEHKVGWLTECQDVLLLLLLLLLGSNNKNVAHTHTQREARACKNIGSKPVASSSSSAAEPTRCARVLGLAHVHVCVCGCGACVCMPESISKILFVFCVSVILTRVLNVRAASRADRASSPTRPSSQATFAFAFPALS